MKEHIVKELVNRLCKITRENHNNGYLPIMVEKEILDALNADVQWHREYGKAKPVMPDMRLHQETDKSFMTRLPEFEP